MEKVNYYRLQGAAAHFLMPNPGQSLSPRQDFGIKAAASVGAIIGQVVFGILSDLLGRKRMCKPITPVSSRRFLECLLDCRWCGIDRYHCRYILSGASWQRTGYQYH
jgi:MFS family permease